MEGGESAAVPPFLDPHKTFKTFLVIVTFLAETAKSTLDPTDYADLTQVQILGVEICSAFGEGDPYHIYVFMQ